MNTIIRIKPNQLYGQQMMLPVFVEPKPPEPFKWLSPSGKTYPVRPEVRGNSIYWYMRKTVNGKTHNLYLGALDKLSSELLNNAVAQIEAFYGDKCPF